MALLLERGFDHVSVAELAAAAGISRATFFRYFPTKADVVWRGFDRALDRMEESLEDAPAEQDTLAAIREAIDESFLATAPDRDVWWQSFMLVNARRSVGGESHDRWARWSHLVTRFVAGRMGVPEGHPVPAAIAWAHLGIYLATLRAWAGQPMDADQMQAQALSSIDLVAAEMAGLLELTN